MLDSSLPLTAQEWEQWGNPVDRDHYVYMRSYSPYDNVERKAYPWMLLTTSINDSQVMYWEPAKLLPPQPLLGCDELRFAYEI